MPDTVGENTQTVNSGTITGSCTPQTLTNPDYRHSLFYVNASCFQFSPTATAANSAFCDSAPGSTLGTGTNTNASSAPLNQCENIRGNLGRDTITGPGEASLDFSAFKNNYIRKISETFNLQFRAEFFNITNHTNFAPPPLNNLTPFSASGAPVKTFGQITTTQIKNRQIQFALKAVW
jgi:hypothetical protein